MAKILIADDEKNIQEFFRILLGREGYQCVCVSSGDEAVKLIEEDIYDLVITDLAMPGIGGMEVLERTSVYSPDTAVIVITAYGTTESAVEAMKKGAADYLLKPFKIEEIKVVIKNALERVRLGRENRRLREELHKSRGVGNLVGTSSVMQEIFTMVEKLAKNRSNVVITGPSGTGKELVARAIHDLSDRAEAPFVTVNCGAIPENLIESELFGYIRGAFTGAVSSKRGLLEVAEKGSFFFDEIGELPAATQVKLLRVLQERKIRRIGGTQDIPIDVRVIAATNMDLEKAVAEGGFREDLFYRLNVFSVHIPALKERPDDIPILVQHFIERHAASEGKRIDGIEDDALNCFLGHAYRGNVRELENLVEQAVVLCDDTRIRLADLPISLRDQARALREKRFPAGPSNAPKEPEAAPSEDAGGNGSSLDLPETLRRCERDLLVRALKRSGGVKTEAAKLLGISFRSMRYRMIKLGLGGDEKY